MYNKKGFFDETSWDWIKNLKFFVILDFIIAIGVSLYLGFSCIKYNTLTALLYIIGGVFGSFILLVIGMCVVNLLSNVQMIRERICQEEVTVTNKRRMDDDE